MKNNRRGFTLIETLIVTTIIGVVSAIAIPNLNRARSDAYNAQAKANLKLIAKALENYYAINNQYPSNVNDMYTANPPYLTADYFSGPYHGYDYTETINLYDYTITAVPTSTQPGFVSYTVTTGGNITQN